MSFANHKSWRIKTPNNTLESFQSTYDMTDAFNVIGIRTMHQAVRQDQVCDMGNASIVYPIETMMKMLKLNANVVVLEVMTPCNQFLILK